MRDELDRHIKATGHENVYFPLFVPRSLLEKEAEHVEGFNPQVAWVTHAGGEPLTEWLAIRPTSEAIIADSVKDWIQSYRDLPLLMNLWNNVVRWELRTRLFLRTAEFLWQEAHTFHATEEGGGGRGGDRPGGLPGRGRGLAGDPGHQGPEERRREVPRGRVHPLHRSDDARHGRRSRPGRATCSARTSPSSAGIEFLDRDNVRKNPWGTSWGFSTRMVGATIMAHGDDSGLVLPPNVAPTQVVIVPIFRTEDETLAVEGAIGPLEAALKDVTTASGPLRVKVDWRDESPGFKYNHWELRGVPFRLEMGPRDVAAGQGVLVRRVDRAKEPIALDALPADLPARLAAYQQSLFQRALDFREANTHRLDTLDDLKALMEGEGGFALAPWCGDAACERRISEETGATIRVIPFDSPDEAGACLVDGRPSARRVLLARAY